MKTIEKNKLLLSIGSIYQQSKNCKLNGEIFKKVDSDLIEVSSYLDISKNQAFLVANIFGLNYKCDYATIFYLAEHFECNPFELLFYKNDFDDLVNRKVLKRKE